MTDPSPLRDRKKQRTKDELTAAAFELFAARGFDSVTVDEIAEQAWVSPRTFFRYFPSKEDVLWTDDEPFRALLRQTILERAGDEGALDAVRNAMVALTELLSPDSREILLRAQIIAGSPTLQSRDLLEHARWEATVEAAVAERLGVDPDSDMTPALVAAASGAALRVAYARWTAAGGSGDLGELIDQSLTLLQNAIRPTSG
jgi:AcrR family transcriptional regulator